ncbi:hypothetical protein GCM10008012_09840 [Rhizobium anhuiense]|nr:hypothetical protein GCM10008012_09840 [Rhizobium anhuiense]
MEKILADLQPQDHAFAVVLPDAIQAGWHHIDIAMLLQPAMLPPVTAALRSHRSADVDSEAMIGCPCNMGAAGRNAQQLGLQAAPATPPARCKDGRASCLRMIVHWSVPFAFEWDGDYPKRHFRGKKRIG